MDRKDLAQMYPTAKPRVVGGEFGYQRMGYWGLFSSPNPAIRMPHERRRLVPKKASVVTVYGASGFLGCQIVRELLAHPDIKTVRACTRYPTLIPKGSDFDNIVQSASDKLELHECDVTDRIQVNVAANGADTLIFAVDYHAEFAHNSHFDVFVTGATNVGWTGRNVKAERVIFCSGMDSTFASESNYVDMRSRGEDACGSNFPDATILRFGPLYGANYRYRGLGRYIYPCCFSETKAQPLWVRDAARAVVRSCWSQRVIRYKLDLGGPETLTHVDVMRRMARYYHNRLVVPCPTSVGRFFSKLAPWTIPNPWFDDNWLLTWELDQCARNPTMFDRLGGWERLEYQPHRMEEAASYDFAKINPETGLPEKDLPTMKELDEVYSLSEKREAEEFSKEEVEARKKGIWRAKAEPGYGRGDGMETVAQEIYPGSQFRIKPLDAPYPKTVKNPGPNNIQ